MVRGGGVTCRRPFGVIWSVSGCVLAPGQERRIAARQRAAVDHHRVTGDRSGLVRGEEHGGLTDLLGRSRPMHRDDAQEELARVRVLQFVARQWRLDESWRDADDTDAATAELQ